MIRSRLEANGIHCYIADVHMSTLYGMMNNFLGGIRVQVSSKDLLLAKTLLNELPPQTDDCGDAGPVLRSLPAHAVNPPADKEEAVNCPACDSDNCRRENSLGVPESISLLLQGFPFLRLHYRYRCFGCSHQWEA